MLTVLYGVFEHLELWGFRFPPPEGIERAHFWSVEDAKWMLKEFLARSENRAMLRSFMAWETSVEVWRYDDLKLEKLLAEMLVRGEVSARVVSDPPPVRTPIERIKYFPPPKLETVPGWIEIRIVWDYDGKGVGGLELELEAPDGSKRKVTTNGQGTVRVDGLVRRGACHLAGSVKDAEVVNSVTMVGEGEKSFGSDKPEEMEVKHLVAAVPLRVADRETLQRIADRAGVLSWKALARFNWGTDEPEKVIEGAVRRVGAERKEKLSELVFSSKDRPGILFVPQPFLMRGLTTNRVHYLRVNSIRWPRRRILVSI